MFLSLSFISYKRTSSSQIFCKDYVNLRVKHYYVVLAEGKSQKIVVHIIMITSI